LEEEAGIYSAKTTFSSPAWSVEGWEEAKWLMMRSQIAPRGPVDRPSETEEDRR